MSDAPPPDTPDFGRLLQGFQEMQEAQAEEYEGQAGGGAVRVRATGDMTFRSVTIAPEAVDPDDVEMVADLVLAALRDLSSRVAAAQRQAIASSGLGNLFGDTESE